MLDTIEITEEEKALLEQRLSKLPSCVGDHSNSFMFVKEIGRLFMLNPSAVERIGTANTKAYHNYLDKRNREILEYLKK
jgi:hypothetical protein